MSRVNKIDFFCGAFLSYIVTNGVKEPTLFDASENSKVISFSLREKDYNAYLKYVSTSRTSTQAGKKYTQWDINFTERERVYINTSFEASNKENIVVLVCSNENLQDTYFAILSLEDAKKCLGNDDVNTQCRISVRRKHGGQYVSCYGTALARDEAVQIKYNFDDAFGFKAS